MEHIKFTHFNSETGESSEFMYRVPEDEDLTWPDVMSMFTRWLSMVYGYDIKEKIALNINKNFSVSAWDGLTFDDLDDPYDWLWEAETAKSGGTD